MNTSNSTSAAAWKCGNEFAAYHPQASHVPPDYRDGWNHCYKAAQAQLADLTRERDVLLNDNLAGMLELVNQNDPARWEVGFRNIVAALHGGRHAFEIADIVEEVRSLKASTQAPRVPDWTHPIGLVIVPTPAEPTGPQPLTDEQIEEERWAAYSNPDFKAGVRFAEAYHGIGAAKEKTE